jgi:hypothetical protein
LLWFNSMNLIMAVGAKRNQIIVRILAKPAAEANVVNLQVLLRRAHFQRSDELHCFEPSRHDSHHKLWAEHARLEISFFGGTVIKGLDLQQVQAPQWSPFWQSLQIPSIGNLLLKLLAGYLIAFREVNPISFRPLASRIPRMLPSLFDRAEDSRSGVFVLPHRYPRVLFPRA